MIAGIAWLVCFVLVVFGLMPYLMFDKGWHDALVMIVGCGAMVVATLAALALG